MRTRATSPRLTARANRASTCLAYCDGWETAGRRAHARSHPRARRSQCTALIADLGAVGGQPAADLCVGVRLSPGRPERGAPGVRHHRAGDERRHGGHRRSSRLSSLAASHSGPRRGGSATAPRCRRHGPHRQRPLGRDIVRKHEQLRAVAPKLLADTVAQAHAPRAAAPRPLRLRCDPAEGRTAKPVPGATTRATRGWRGRQPARARTKCGSVRNPEVATRASRRASLAPATLKRSRKRSSCLGLMACMAKPRSSNASTTGPCRTSIAAATRPGSPATDTIQSHKAAKPAPPCANARSQPCRQRQAVRLGAAPNLSRRRRTSVSSDPS